MTKVSVVIPTYNAADCIIDAIESILGQTYKGVEIIIVDDGSIDNTREILNPYIENGKVKYFYQENKGPSAARNKGIEKAGGEYVAFLDADDTWLPFKLELQINHLLNNPDILAVSTQMLEHGEESNLTPYFRDYQFKRYFFKDMLIRNYMGIFSTALIRGDILKKAGYFREDLIVSEDHELWLRLSELGELQKIMVPTAVYRKRPDGLSAGNRDRTTKETIKFVKRIFSEEYLEYKKQYLRAALSTSYFHISIDYTQMKKYYEAMKYLMLSIMYCPFRYPERLNCPLLRLRRFLSICRSFIYDKLYNLSILKGYK